jgi:hypothetical protein
MRKRFGCGGKEHKDLLMAWGNGLDVVAKNIRTC